MTGNTPNSDEYLVLSDQQTSYYAIPRHVLEQYRVPQENTPALVQALNDNEDDVTGFSYQDPYAAQSRVTQYQSEMRQTAARERSLRDTDHSSSASGSSDESARRAMRTVGTVLTGIFMSLPFLGRGGT